MYLCVRFASFYVFSIGLWNCSDIVVFVIGLLNYSDSVVFVIRL